MKLYCGARQLQALVRLRTTSHSSGPSRTGSWRGTRRPCPTRRRCDAESADAPSSPIDTAPRTQRDSPWNAPSDLKRTRPDGWRPR